jgi:DNA-binding XRE family transcriptional regulator
MGWWIIILKEVINMNHDEAKKLLVNNPDVKSEYDGLEPIYEIRKQLIELRLQQGLSQKDLAEIIGTKQSAISRLENGSYNPSIDFLSKLAHALGKEIQVKFY